MGVPSLTMEQRSAALEKAAQVRRERAAVKNRLKCEQGSLGDVLTEGRSNDVIGRMRVSALLEAMPGIGRAKSKAVMAEIGIADNRRVRGLGGKQIEALLTRFHQA